MRRWTWIVVCFLLGVLWVAYPATVHGQEGEPPTQVTAPTGAGRMPTDDEVNAIAKKLYCPVCPNTPLDVCETLACRDWREQIREQLAAGWTEEQIIAYFVDRYGQRVLAEPQRQGFAALAWVLPVIAVISGLGIVFQVLRSWRRRRATATAVAQATPLDVSPEVVARVEKEIQELW